MNDELDIVAAEYVLGTLPADDRARFARRLLAEPELREAVERWQARLAPLDAAATPEPPPETAWAAIEAAVAGRPAASRATPDHDAELASNVVSLRRRVALWRTATYLTGALAAGLAIAAWLDRAALPPEQAGGRYVAVVDTGGREPALIAEVDTNTGTIRIRSLAAETPAGRSLELWHVAEGHPPQSLGLLNARDGAQTIPGAPSEGPLSGIIAVSVEPQGGSPSGAPTGPVVYSGQLVPME